MSRQLTSDPITLGQELFESSATQKHRLGSLATDGNGRYFRYAQAGAVALVRGNVLQAPAQVTTHDQLTPVAADIGANSITVTLDATNDAAANQYAEGLAVIDTTPGLGQFVPISGHPFAALSTALTLQIDMPLEVALTTSSRVTLVPNPYKGVIQSPITTLTGAVVGVAVKNIAAGEFGWIGVRGSFGVLIAGTPGVGLAVVVPGTAAGAVVIDGATAATQVVGSMMVTGVDGKVLPVLLNLP
jgi:VCBS repeat-containing protein